MQSQRSPQEPTSLSHSGSTSPTGERLGLLTCCLSKEVPQEQRPEVQSREPGILEAIDASLHSGAWLSFCSVWCGVFHSENDASLSFLPGMRSFLYQHTLNEQ